MLAHVLECWDHWLAVTYRPKKGDRRYAEALVLARRVLRRWRHWTVWEQLLAPTWQQIRLNARLLPPLPAINLDSLENFAHYLPVTGGLLQPRRRMGKEDSTCNLALRRISVATYAARTRGTGSSDQRA